MTIHKDPFMNVIPYHDDSTLLVKKSWKTFLNSDLPITDNVDTLSNNGLTCATGEIFRCNVYGIKHPLAKLGHAFSYAVGCSRDKKEALKIFNEIEHLVRG